MSQVSLSDAAKMANITRSTLYAHIEEKGITVIDKGSKRPKIDVSELVRVYGDKIRPIDDSSASQAKRASAIDNNPAIEVAILREKLKTADLERDRERRQLSEQIENLQEQLKGQQEVVGKITALLTDQRSSAEKQTTKEEEQTKRFSELEYAVRALAERENSTAGKKPWWRFR